MRKYLLAIIFFADIVISGFISYKILSLKFSKSNLTPSEITVKNEEVIVTPGLFDGESTNILLLGYGGAGHDGGNLSDVIMVVSVSPSAKTASFISVPRDLWVEIPIRSDKKQNYKINAAYAIGGDDRNYPLKEPQYKGAGGGGFMAKKVISEVTGLTLNNYISINFDNFKKIIDSLGGVGIDVPVAFDDYLYPVKGLENATCGFSAVQIAEFHRKYSGFDLEKQFTCRYEHLHFEKGIQNMDGDTALKFVRSRHSVQDGGDFARSRRQKAVLLGMKDKLFSLYALKKVDKLFDEFKGFISTDLDLKEVKILASVIGSPEEYKIKFISLTEENVLLATKSMDGQFILIPKEGENVWRGVQKYIYDETRK